MMMQFEYVEPRGFTQLYWRMRYVKFWAGFKVRLAFKPYISITPSSSWANKYVFERTGFGCILWTPGVPRKKCGKRIHVSWRRWLEGPADWRTWVYLQRRRAVCEHGRGHGATSPERASDG